MSEEENEELAWKRIKGGFFMDTTGLKFFMTEEEDYPKICRSCERAHELLDKGDSAGSYLHCCGKDLTCGCVCRSWRRPG